LADLLASESHQETFLLQQFVHGNHTLMGKNQFPHEVLPLLQQRAL
jgi:hypothetical protein